MKMDNECDFEAEARRDIAIDALDAIHDLCTQAAAHGGALDLVNANSFACLLDLIVGELRGAQSVEMEARPQARRAASPSKAKCDGRGRF